MGIRTLRYRIITVVMLLTLVCWIFEGCPIPTIERSPPFEIAGSMGHLRISWSEHGATQPSQLERGGAAGVSVAGGAMQFAIEHEKAAIGHDITVAVMGENGQLIARVITEYDSSQLGDDQLEPPANQYGRSWTKKGLAGPGQQHMVRVLATDPTGKQENAVAKWEG